jgi:hypothetical protein
MLATYAFSALFGFGSSLFWLMKAEAKQARRAIGPADLSLVHHDETHPSHVTHVGTGGRHVLIRRTPYSEPRQWWMEHDVGRSKRNSPRQRHLNKGAMLIDPEPVLPTARLSRAEPRATLFDLEAGAMWPVGTAQIHRTMLLIGLPRQVLVGADEPTSTQC